MIKTVKQWAIRAVRWFIPEAKLHRWKVLLTLLAVAAMALGFYNMVEAKNNEQLHQLQCLRAQSRDDLRVVLFAFAHLPAEFGTSDAVKIYEDSRQLIVNTVLQPIHVDGCPES